MEWEAEWEPPTDISEEVFAANPDMLAAEIARLTEPWS
jgi:hypothetical protein